LHADSVAPIFLPNKGDFRSYGEHLRMGIPRRSIVELRSRAEEEWDVLRHSGVVYQIFPNSLVIWLTDHVEVWQMYPAGRPGRCRMRFSLLVPEEPLGDAARRHWDSNWQLTIDTVDNEDFVMAAGIQRGIESGTQKTVVYGRNEPGMQHYAKAIRAAVAV
jgi:hypothetical protein